MSSYSEYLPGLNPSNVLERPLGRGQLGADGVDGSVAQPVWGHHKGTHAQGEDWVEAFLG